MTLEMGRWLRKSAGVALAAGFFAVPAHADILVTISSTPEGATVARSDGTVIGVTPLVVKIKSTKKECGHSAGWTATWVSGASATQPPFTACEKDGKKITKILMRPTGVDGMAADVNYSIELARLKLMRDQAAIDAYVKLRQQRERESQSRPQLTLPPLEPLKRQEPLRCVSRQSGNTVYTDCN